MSDCLFCRIVEGDVPADIVLRTDRVVAFRDINPQAPVHVLVIPTAHHVNAGDLAAADPALAGHLLAAAAQVAEAEGLTGGYRIVLNTGADAGQTVFHVHAHVLGGRDLLWPPG
jgi:histidine triad (HIT) family protein